MIDAVHAAGGKMGPQLWHTGGVPSSDAGFAPGPLDTPSGLNAPGQPAGEPMSEEAIADTVAAFARAAADAKALGFDTLEIHGAHGYLIDQFFWSGTNLRHDRYGGATIAERARFAAEVVAAIRAAVGPDYPILLRVSQWKQQDYTARLAQTPGEMEQWLRPLVEAGVDILHCSQRRFWEPEFPEIDGEHGLNFAGWAKKLTGAPTISVGSVGLSGDFFGAFRGQSAGRRRPRRPGRAHGARRVRPDRGRPRAAVRSAVGHQGPRRRSRSTEGLRPFRDDGIGLIASRQHHVSPAKPARAGHQPQ